MPETFRRRWFRRAMNLFPAFRGAGGKLTYIADDWREIRLQVPLSWRTRNYVGTIYGGSMYGAVDPVYMIMLLKILGPEYVVWDKAATIRFKKPGRGTLFAKFLIEEPEVAAIKTALETEKSIDRVYGVDLADAAGSVHATIEKTLYISKKRST